MTEFFKFNSDEKLNIKIKEPEVEFSIIKRLGKPKFFVSNNDFNEIMEKIYRAASKRAIELWFNANELLEESEKQNGFMSSND